MTNAKKQRMKESISRRALALPDLQATFAAGVAVWYKYYDTTGKCVLDFSAKK